MRGLPVSTLLVVLLVAAGCGGGGEAAKPATQVIADAVKAAEAASSMHVSAQLATQGGKVGVDMSIVRNKGATGSLTHDGTKVGLIVIGGKAYVRAGPAFWGTFQPRAAARRYADKWGEFPTSTVQLASVTIFTRQDAYFRALTYKRKKGRLTNQGRKTYKGQSVIAIRDTASGRTAYFSASGTPYPVALPVRRIRGTPGSTLTFDRWNRPVTLTAPKGAIRFDLLVADVGPCRQVWPSPCFS
jgi:hypothetical protein